MSESKLRPKEVGVAKPKDGWADAANALLAHIDPTDSSRVQTLVEHLQGTSDFAASFAEAFGAADWAALAGLWHDLGKASAEFQEYLRRAVEGDQAQETTKVDHSSAGAQHAVASLDSRGFLLAYPIAGHHAGLLDGISEHASLEKRLKKSIPDWTGRVRASILEPPELPVPPNLARSSQVHDVAFFVRMLFSCLVDADFLDTEAFVDPQRAKTRPQWPANVLERLEQRLDEYVAALGGPQDNVSVQRRKVRSVCLDAAEQEPGLFSLTVPTGGGKTLSSLAFALRHARIHGLRRVIYVAPFTSIIEQNADVFRKVFAPLVEAGLPDPVLEHHSDVDIGQETTAARLATENWEAPIVVTTAVQFYESLFANKSRRCRKLHNIARSVVILDEAQKIPVEYLKPILFALRTLADGYGTTIVLCTATQPAVHFRPKFEIGLKGVREIIPDPPSLYEQLKRVDVEVIGDLDDDALVGRLGEHEQVLCIVNTRRHARELYRRLSDLVEGDGVFHLSASMCPVHRTQVFKEVRERLEQGRPCLVVTTQLVEAGVDVDFPVVYRSMAGLDSIAQAAGRCNRNGRLPVGHTYVFQSEHGRSERFLASTVDAAQQVIPDYSDLLSLDAVEQYFKLYYWDKTDEWDAKNILRDRQGGRDLPFLFHFASIAGDFRLIQSIGKPVIVPWGGDGGKLCASLRFGGNPPARDVLRGLQRYTVQAPLRLWDRALGSSIELVHDQYPVLVSPKIHYDDRLGLVLDRGDTDLDFIF